MTCSGNRRGDAKLVMMVRSDLFDHAGKVTMAEQKALWSMASYYCAVTIFLICPDAAALAPVILQERLWHQKPSKDDLCKSKKSPPHHHTAQPHALTDAVH